MSLNEAVINKFYNAFAKKDYETMNACYAEDIAFSDPAFGLLRGNEVKAMWQMLCTNAKDFSLHHSNIFTDDNEYYTSEWTAKYTFSKTGKTVVNKCKAFMRIKDGVILEHSDAFNFYRWCRQALGLKGLLFGWTGFMQRKVNKTARKGLERFMKENNIQ